MKFVGSAAVILAAVALTATACSSSTHSTSPSSSPASSAPPPASSSPASPSQPASPNGTGTTAAVSVAVEQTPLGKILVDGQGRTLYLFEKDTSSTSNCNGACASAWPPATVTGTPQAGGGVTAGLLGTTMRTDHSTQLTYHGHPLYLFSGDQKPGDTKGEGSKAFGAGWYVVAPTGNKIDNS